MTAAFDFSVAELESFCLFVNESDPANKSLTASLLADLPNYWNQLADDYKAIILSGTPASDTHQAITEIYNRCRRLYYEIGAALRTPSPISRNKIFLKTLTEHNKISQAIVAKPKTEGSDRIGLKNMEFCSKMNVLTYVAPTN